MSQCIRVVDVVSVQKVSGTFFCYFSINNNNLMDKFDQTPSLTIENAVEKIKNILMHVTN